MGDEYQLDVVRNRSTRKWSRKELIIRLLWELSRPLFAWSPRPLWGWRRFLLRLFGARIGCEVHIYPSVRIAIPWNLNIGDHSAVGDRAILYSLGPILLAERVTVSQGAHLCAGTHDYRDPAMPLLKPPITIARDAWVCADAFVGPGVFVGAFAIVGARCVVTKDVEPGVIMIGNPAKPLGCRAEKVDMEKAARKPRK
ncbi:colanic acid biosynthesis acetyltransferase WcaF [Mesorhizobium sp.]|uniref:colanic acid biosynthesis acetyltransferase WcaF n=1 Tax=Mesorhizobium sp. TaxID=1871066 RepID=UPI000FEA0976|nr:colanic acid biosynthesis acetyltransferase WcaF [Mesorhizobium sp.]RWM75509.1 MAG: acetyltransferase [Mesorhizobium sp.]TIO23338.1 MAG: acetyltransferase [Mesorhizobium sp.]TJV61455.1 MAG: acetyltransferase [Mesorhizobium sp.]